MYYKVVKQTSSGCLISCANSYIVPEDWSVTYIPNEWTEPVVKDTLLFCFTSLEAAIEFASDSPNLQIWECEVEGRLLPFNVLSKYSESLESFWHRIKNDPGAFSNYDLDIDIGLREAPKNTIGVSRIKLVKKISEHNI